MHKAYTVHYIYLDIHVTRFSVNKPKMHSHEKMEWFNLNVLGVLEY